MILLLLDNSSHQNQSYELGCAIFACVRREYIIRARSEPLQSSGRTQEGPENATDITWWVGKQYLLGTQHLAWFWNCSSQLKYHKVDYQ